jgi:Helix-turn-helix domain
MGQRGPVDLSHTGAKDFQDVLDEFDGRMISPGGAAALLGLSRKTIYTLCERGTIRAFRGEEDPRGGGDGYKWVLIPLDDVGEYARRVGRPVPKVCERRP